MIHDWQASMALGDPADWLTVLAYLLAALFALRALREAGVRHQPRAVWFWRFTVCALLFLALNEILDLQTLLALAGREHARAHGWYETRRAVQLDFVVGLTLAAIASCSVAMRLVWNEHIGVRLALMGLAFIGLFVVVRALSINHVDEALSIGTGMLRLGALQEFTGIATVAGAAWLYIRNQNVR